MKRFIYKFYGFFVILFSMLGVVFIFSGISHRSSFFGGDYPLWRFDPVMIAIGSGFLVGAFLLFIRKRLQENSSHGEELYFGEEIHFSCKKCQAKYSAKPEQAGKEGKCKKCGERLLVPDISDFA